MNLRNLYSSENVADQIMDHKGLAMLEPLTEALQCHICHNFFTAPVMLPCGHSYCSECIRSNMEYKRKQTQPPTCPECRKPVESNQLTANFALRETVTAFSRALPQLQDFIRSQTAATKHLQEQLQQHQEQRVSGCDITNNRALTKPDSSSEQKPQKRASDVRSGISKLASRKPAAAEVCVLDDDEDGDAQQMPERNGLPCNRPLDDVGDQADDDHETTSDPCQRQPHQDGNPQQAQPAPAPGSVLCPSCGMSVRESLINTHLDNCLSRSGAAQGDKPPPHPTSAPPSTVRVGHRGSGGGAVATAATNNNSTHKRPADASTSSGPNNSMQGLHQVQPAVKKRKTNSLSTTDLPPSLVFNVMKDRDLRTKLKQLGLPTDGTKEEMVERYTSFRRYVQVKLDEGTTMDLAQVRASFLAQQRYQQAARRVSPALAAAGNPLMMASGNATGPMTSAHARASSKPGVSANNSMHTEAAVNLNSSSRSATPEPGDTVIVAKDVNKEAGTSHVQQRDSDSRPGAELGASTFRQAHARTSVSGQKQELAGVASASFKDLIAEVVKRKQKVQPGESPVGATAVHQECTEQTDDQHIDPDVSAVPYAADMPASTGNTIMLYPPAQADASAVQNDILQGQLHIQTTQQQQPGVQQQQPQHVLQRPTVHVASHSRRTILLQGLQTGLHVQTGQADHAAGPGPPNNPVQEAIPHAGTSQEAIPTNKEAVYDDAYEQQLLEQAGLSSAQKALDLYETVYEGEEGPDGRSDHAHDRQDQQAEHVTNQEVGPVGQVAQVSHQNGMARHQHAPQHVAHDDVFSQGGVHGNAAAYGMHEGDVEHDDEFQDDCEQGHDVLFDDMDMDL